MSKSCPLNIAVIGLFGSSILTTMCWGLLQWNLNQPPIILLNSGHVPTLICGPPAPRPPPGAAPGAGAGCSEAHVVVERPDTHDVFVGDLVANKNHSWLEIGKTDEWLTRLDEIRKLGPKRVFPGRGQPGGASLLDDEGAYLKKVIAIVAAEKPSLPIDDAAFERAKKNIVDAYPSYGYPVFLEIGLPAEWKRQATKK